MKKIYIFVIVLVLSCTSAFSQINTVPKFEKNMLMMRIIESANLFVPSRIYITDGYGLEYTQELKYAANGKSMTENAVVIANVMNQLMEQGYELISSNGTSLGNDGSPIFANYIFRKPK